MNKESSDEKLLKLIEGTNKIKSLPQVGVKQKTASLGQSLKFNFNNFKLLKLNLYSLNKGLFIIGVILTLYFFYSFIKGAQAVSTDLTLSGSGKNYNAPKFIAKEESKIVNLQDYKAVAKRNIFLPAGKKSALAKQEEGPNILELAKDLKLVGVVWSSSPEVMIENTKESRTYLLKKGEIFSQQQFKVKDILRNSVVLEISGVEGRQECELR